jgi:hypothetical protein
VPAAPVVPAEPVVPAAPVLSLGELLPQAPSQVASANEPIIPTAF